ncbi:hypothetical protein J1605_004880 [Eschrichtius robustus]|uniref:Uncharacterized protein n=1 Tax=Eschrichtius robustus TaxID=9764 RepID=A0AB34HEI2_ESCRO|nr:hypothetical protein J1605_004880 [Eschrichtius robustus]
MDPDFQENVGCPWPLGYGGHQNSALILTKELWYDEERGLCFHSEVKNEPHMPQLLKPAHLEPVLCNKRSRCNEKPGHRNEE